MVRLLTEVRQDCRCWGGTPCLNLPPKMLSPHSPLHAAEPCSVSTPNPMAAKVERGDGGEGRSQHTAPDARVLQIAVHCQSGHSTVMLDQGSEVAQQPRYLQCRSCISVQPDNLSLRQCIVRCRSMNCVWPLALCGVPF